jgi:hypothetical protein
LWVDAKARDQAPRSFTEPVEALKKTTLLPNIRDNSMNSMMALNQAGKPFQEYPRLLNDFERRLKADMNDGVRCNRFIIGEANITLMTHALPHRRKLPTLILIVELQNFFNRLVVGSRLSSSRPC